MKLCDHRFWKYEAMMAVSAVIASVIICSPLYDFSEYALRTALCISGGLIGGHLFGGVLTWKVFIKEKWVGWIKLTIVQTFFTYILFLIVVFLSILVIM